MWARVTEPALVFRHDTGCCSLTGCSGYWQGRKEPGTDGGEQFKGASFDERQPNRQVSEECWLTFPPGA